MDHSTLESLSSSLGHEFDNTDLLRDALRHPSAMPAPGGADRGYERLEFLGDRVLGLVMADLLYDAFPDEDEGALSRRFVALVRRETLVRIAESIGLGAHIETAPTDIESNARRSAAILADSCEAVIAALYLDGGLQAARAFIERYWKPLIAENATPPKDAKTALQEWVQGRGRALPDYRVVAELGPAHEPVFTVEVRIKGFDPVVATGPSKRAAEQAAAEALLAVIATADHG